MIHCFPPEGKIKASTRHRPAVGLASQTPAPPTRPHSRGPPAAAEPSPPSAARASSRFASSRKGRLHLNFPEPPGVGGGADPPRKPPGGALFPATRGPAPPERGPWRPSGGPRRHSPPPQPFLHHAQRRAPSERLPQAPILNLQARPPIRRSASARVPLARDGHVAASRAPAMLGLPRSGPRHLRPQPLACCPPLRPAREETKCCGRETRRRRRRRADPALPSRSPSPRSFLSACVCLCVCARAPVFSYKGHFTTDS